MSSLRWFLVAAAFVAGLSEVSGESTAFPHIPDSLLECYMDDGIYHRANRMPATFESFLDLLRKVEDSPTSRNLNARELALVLLSYLKLDGIQRIPLPTKDRDILPVAPSGDEYFKHRLTLIGLVPRIDQSYVRAVNETLSTKEMCNLHFMLSSSVDPYRREDERCTLFEESRRPTHPEPRSEWDPYQNIRGYYRRHRRRVDHAAESNRVAAPADKLPHLRKATEGRRDADPPRRKRSNEKAQVESIPLKHQGVHGEDAGSEKDKFTIGNQELLSAAEFDHKAGMQSLTQGRTFGRGGAGAYLPRIGQGTEDGIYSGLVPGIQLSDCPVVNGVVSTPSGALSIGTVVAGVAAGLNPEDIMPEKLSVNPADLESRSDRVKNVWATTLAGTVADAITSSAVLDRYNLQILKGGWNDSADPKWYLLKSNQFKHMTEVAIRGSLDGLILGLHAKEWTNRYPNFKLSQMLQIYYDCFWGSVGAKNRVQLAGKFAPEDIFRKQTLLMSLVLKKQKMNTLTILNFRDLVREAVVKVTQHFQTMDDKDKAYLGSFQTTKIDNAVNMIAVIDSSWGHENLYRVFDVLRSAQVASTQESNLTVVCGSDGRVLMTSSNSADLHNRFTRDALLENCTRGMNLPLILDTLELLYRQIYVDEKTSQRMNTDAQVAILFPFESPFRENLDYVVEKSRNFRSSFPDVRLMIAANGRSEPFQQLVKDRKDLFALAQLTSDPSLRTVREFADGVKQSYQRVTRPTCGSYFDDHSPGEEVRVTRDVIPGNIAYYRLLPQYFYTVSGEATVTIRSKLRAPLTVCHSREMDRPAGPSPRGSPDFRPGPGRDPNYDPDLPPEPSPYGSLTEEDGPVQCKTITSETYRIQLNNPCGGAPTLADCLPLYISLMPALQESGTIICPTCRLPVNVQYEISATGLTCYNSAATLVLSPVLLCLLSVLLYFK